MISLIKNKAKVLRADPHMREVARGTMLAFVLKVAGSGLAFAFNVAIARMLGAEGAGLYFLALSVTAIGSIIGSVGLDNALLRFTATHATQGEWGKVKGVHALGMRLAIGVSALLSILGFIAAGWIATWLFHKPELTAPLRWMSLSILPFTMLNLQAESLKGLKRIRDAMLLQGIGVPLLGLFLIWPLAGAAGVVGVAWAYFAATVLMALLGGWAWRNTVSGIVEAAESYPFAALWASCKSLLVISLMSGAVLSWAPLFLLGVWASAAEVGIFGAATRLALIVSVLLVTLNNVIAPKFAELYAIGDIVAMGKMARGSAAMLTLIVSPIFLFLFVFSEWVMQLFGSEFAAGGGVLAILLIGQFVNVFTGSVGYLLMMSGSEKTVRNITIGSAILQLVLVLLLAPLMGGIGAAIASAVALATLNLASVYAVYKKFGIITIPGVARFL